MYIGQMVDYERMHGRCVPWQRTLPRRLVLRRRQPMLWTTKNIVNNWSWAYWMDITLAPARGSNPPQ